MRRSHRSPRLTAILALTACPLVAPFARPLAQTTVTLQGGGATSPLPLLQQWFADFSKLDPAVRFDYQAVGSGKGQKLLSSQFVDFAGSDAPMSEEALANAPGKILHVPVVGGADVIIFNLHGVKKLRLDGPALAAIYLGKITQWNDPAIVRQNPGVRLPDVQITVAHRSDGSGSTFVFTDYLCKVSPEWMLKVGRYLTVNWPAGVAQAGNGGVSNFVKKTPGAIGYVELVFAVQNQLTQVSIRNASGNYIEASTASITAALATARVPADFRLSIVDSPGAGSYPVSGVLWLLVYEDPGDPVKARALASFLRWTVTDGQKTAERLNFAPLPASLTGRVLQAIARIATPAQKAAEYRP